MRRAALAILLIATALIHAIPYLATETPFSTDVWPLIEISQRLLENPDLRIWMDSAFDGYNNRWPGAVLAATLLSQVLELDLYTLYGLYMVAVLNIAIVLLIYATCRRFESSILSIALLLAIPSFTIFTSSTLKEVYSYPIMLCIYLLALRSRNIRRYIAVMPLLAFAHVLCHHLSTAMSVLIALGALAVLALDRLLGYDTPRALAKNLAIYILLAAPIATAYYVLYGGYGLRIVLSINDIASLAMYLALAYTIPTVLAPSRRGLGLAWRSLLVGLCLALFTVSIRLHLVMGLELELGNLYPYAIGALLPALIPRQRSALTYVSRSIAMSIAAVMSFIVFSKPVLNNVLHRIANYLALYYSIASYRVDRAQLRALATAVAVIGIALSTSILLALSLGLDNVCFYWLYRPEDVALGTFLARYAEPSIKVLGDAKLSYFEAMKLRVDTSSLLKVLSLGLRALPPRSLLVVSVDNVERGFAVGLNIYRLPTPLHELDSALSRVLSSHSYAWYWC